MWPFVIDRTACLPPYILYTRLHCISWRINPRQACVHGAWYRLRLHAPHAATAQAFHMFFTGCVKTARPRAGSASRGVSYILN